MTRCTPSVPTSRRNVSALPISSASSPRSGSVATTTARAWLVTSFSRTRSARSGSPMTRQRSERGDAPGQPAGQHPAARDREQRREPQARDLARRRGPVDQQRRGDGQAQRVQAGELQQQRRLVERGVHDPHLVAVVEAGHLEEEHEREAGHDGQIGQLEAGDRHDERERHRGGEHVRGGQQAPVQRLATGEARQCAVVVSLGAPAPPPGHRDNARPARGPGERIVVNREPGGELWRHIRSTVVVSSGRDLASPDARSTALRAVGLLGCGNTVRISTVRMTFVMARH